MCENDGYTYEDVEKIANFLKSKVDIKPKVGVVCGTGLGSITSLISNITVLPYNQIPDFPVSTVQGHDGQLCFGYIGKIPVVCMQGRFHLFEGYPLQKCVLPVRVMKLLGISILLLSNAAGGINSKYTVGDIMLIKDHVNFVTFGGNNPLQGVNEERFGPRFVAMNDAYDKDLLNIAKAAAGSLKGVQEGVYACLGGPSFETVAELKILQLLGADAVGMSTVHEVITARHCGIRCLAFSLITNMCPMDYDSLNKPNHVEILDVGKIRERDVQEFVERLFQRLGEEI